MKLTKAPLWSRTDSVLSPRQSGNGVFISVPTASREALILKTTDDDATKSLFEARKSNDVVMASIGATGSVLFQNAVDSTTGFQILDADGGTPVFNVDTANEMIGIGTNAPGHPLHIVTSVAVPMRVEGTDDGQSVLAWQNTVQDWRMGVKSLAQNSNFLIQDFTNTKNIVEIEPGADTGSFKILAGSTVFNEGSNSRDFRVESNTDINMFFLDGGNNAITIGGTTELAKFGIEGNANEIQLAVRANPTQTLHGILYEESDGTDLWYVDGSGDMRVTQHSALGNSASISANKVVDLNEVIVDVASPVGIDVLLQLEPTTDQATTAIGLQLEARLDTGFSYTTLHGIQGLAKVNAADVGKTITNVRGAILNAVITNGVAATVTRMEGVRTVMDAEDGTVGSSYSARLVMTSVDTGSLTSSYGVYVDSAVIGAGSVTNQYGIYIENITGADTRNYAFYSNTGPVHVGDKVQFTQTDGNEAIDSLADGYMDYLATTAHRFNAPITVPAYERHIQIPALLTGNQSNTPTAVDFFTVGGLQWASTLTKYAFFQWEIPDDWDGGDIVVEVDWFPDSGAMAGTDAVKWDVEYRAIAEGELINAGTSVTLTVTNTDDNAQYLAVHSPMTMAYNDANQPLTAQDHLYFKVSRDTGVANDFAGTVTVPAFEIIYQSTTLPGN